MKTQTSPRLQALKGLLAPARDARYYLYPGLLILLLSAATGLFRVDDKVINYASMVDYSGETRAEFLEDLNLPLKMGAVLLRRIGGQVVPSEKLIFSYGPIDGEILPHQLMALLLHKQVTERTIAFFVNGMFGVFAILFSLLAGYLILGNGYLSVPIFLFLALFDRCSPGLIYGMPDMHAYMIFNPLIMYCLLGVLLYFLNGGRKKAAPLIVLCGTFFAYTIHVRTSEGMIEIAALGAFFAVLLLQHQHKRRLLGALAIASVLLGLGCATYSGATEALRRHRDSKISFAPRDAQERAYAPFFHPLYVALFRYDVPNRFDDSIGINAFYEAYPEMKEKFTVNPFFKGTKTLLRLPYSKEYGDGIRTLYFRYIAEHPGRFFY